MEEGISFYGGFSKKFVFVDYILSIDFGENKTKWILFGSKHKIKKSKPLNTQYNDIEIKLN